MQLSYDTIEQGSPSSYLYMLHGIFGAGRNWASIARRLVRERPDWGVRLIDLRQHGSSQGFAAPHTIEAAARDIAELAGHLGENPAGILGHSFGGKVALMYARAHARGLRQIWIIDSTPDARTPAGSAWRMLEIVRSCPTEFESRNDLVEQLQPAGVTLPIAQWMATNLEYRDGAYRWRFDLDAIEDLLLDFFRTDLWDVVDAPPEHADLHFVKGSESNLLDPAAVERITTISAANPRVHFHEIAGGHWLNAENPEALHDLLAANL